MVLLNLLWVVMNGNSGGVMSGLQWYYGDSGVVPTSFYLIPFNLSNLVQVTIGLSFFAVTGS